MRSDRGQATIELVGAVPVVLAVCLAVVQVLAAGLARELADHAAEAGAVAVLEDADPGAAARAALPGWAHTRVVVKVAGGDVTVRLHPPSILPGLGDLLDARAHAHAGKGRV